MFNDRFFKRSTAVLIILAIVFLLGQLDFFFEPIRKFVAILFFPILISGFLYYLLRPLVRLVEKLRIKRTIAILLVFILVIGIFSLLGSYSGVLISKQLNQLILDLPSILQAGKNTFDAMVNSVNIGALITTKIQDQITSAAQNIVPVITKNIFGAFSAVANFTAILVMVPFILFYFLKDDNIFAEIFLKWFSPKYKNEVSTVMGEADSTLSAYITGQGIVALILGTLMYIGFLIIGLPYSIILAIFAMFMSFIPYFGAVIGIIPAAIVGISQSPIMLLKVVIIVIIVQQLEGNFISPNLIGKRLDIHPLTIILLFLVAASFYGLIGMLIAVPVYAVLKVFIKNFIRIYKLKIDENL